MASVRLKCGHCVPKSDLIRFEDCCTDVVEQHMCAPWLHLASRIASRALAFSLHIVKPFAHSSDMFHRRRRILLCLRPWLVDLLPRALANQLEIYNDRERTIISDIFIVRDWEHGQPLTIIRRIFLSNALGGENDFLRVACWRYFTQRRKPRHARGCALWMCPCAVHSGTFQRPWHSVSLDSGRER